MGHGPLDRNTPRPRDNSSVRANRPDQSIRSVYRPEYQRGHVPRAMFGRVKDTPVTGDRWIFLRPSPADRRTRPSPGTPNLLMQFTDFVQQRGPLRRLPERPERPAFRLPNNDQPRRTIRATTNPRDRRGGSDPPPSSTDAPKPRLLIVPTAMYQLMLAALDKFDRVSPGAPLRNPEWRPGAILEAGDSSTAVGMTTIGKDYDVVHSPVVNVGHEPQALLSVGLQSGAPSTGVLGLSAQVDLLHHEFQIPNVGKLDWHVLTAQGSVNLTSPTHLQLGFGASTGVELHPGDQERLSVWATLEGGGQSEVDLLTGRATVLSPTAGVLAGFTFMWLD